MYIDFEEQQMRWHTAFWFAYGLTGEKRFALQFAEWFEEDTSYNWTAVSHGYQEWVDERR